MSGGGGTNTTTSSNSPPQQYLDAYSKVNTQAQQAASVPYQSYSGQIVAGLSPDQQQGISDVQSAQGIATPYINSAASYLDKATTPIWNNVQQFSPSTISQYENPYTDQVVNATQAQFNNQNQIQQQGIIGNAVSQGAYGGDRSAVAQAVTAGQQQANQAPTIANLKNQGYSQALGEFNQQQGAQIGANEANAWLNSQAGSGMASLGNEALNTALTGANAELSVGNTEQQQAQANLNVPYQQYTAAQAYPFQTTGWLANIAEGLGGSAGGTSSTTSPSASTGSQLAGAATTGLGVLGVTGAFGSNGYLTGSNGLFSSGSGSTAGIDQGTWTTSARGGIIPHRSSGGGLSDFSAPGGAFAVSTGVPDVSVSVVPGSTGMGSAPATHGTMDILKNYGSTSTTTSSGNLGGIGSLLGGIGGSLVAPGIGTFIGSTAGNALGSQIRTAHGGIIPFPTHRTRAGGGGITANDNWDPEPVRHFATGGYSVTTAPSAHGGTSVPMLSYTPGSGAGITSSGTGSSTSSSNQSVQDYLNQQQQGASYAAPKGYVAPTVSSTSNVPAGLTQAAIDYANSQAANLALIAQGSSTGSSEWRGGRVRHDAGGIIGLDDGGDVPETGGIVNDMLDAPHSNQVTPQEATAWWQLHGKSPAGAAGIVQNMDRESGMHSDIHGDYDRAGNPTSLGLFQHHADREAALKQFAAAQGKSATDPYVQMQFAQHELSTDMPGLNRTLATTTNPAEAESAFRTQFERPASSGHGSASPSGGITTASSTSQPSLGFMPSASDVVEPPAYSPWRMLTNIGLGILSGTSPNAGVNIGRGALEGIQVSDKEKQAEATQALSRQQAAATNAYRQATLTLENARQAEGVRHDTATEKQAAAALAQQESLRRDAMVPAELRLAQIMADPNTPQAVKDAYQRNEYLKKGLADPFGQPTGNAPPAANGAVSAPPTGEEFLKTVNPTLQPQIKALAEGRLAMPSRPSPQQQQLINLTAQYDPTFDATDYNKRNKTASDFAPNGKSGQAIQFINNALSHAAKLADQAQQMPSQTSSDLINTPVNWLSQHVMGDTAPVNVAQTRDALANEMRKVFATSGGGGLEELRSWEKSFPVNGSPAQIQEAVRNAIELMEPRLNGLAHAYTVGMGTNHTGFDLLPETGKQAYQKLMGGVPETANVRTPTYNQSSQPAAQPATQQPAAAPASWRYNATGPGGATVHSNDGKTWFMPDGKPYAP